MDHNTFVALFGSPGAVGGVYSDQYQTLYDALATKPSDEIASAQDTFVSAIVDGGVWVKLDALWVFAQTTSAGALKNWVTPGTHDCSLVNAPAFTALEGFAGNGTTSYINSNFSPSVDGVNYTQNSASYGLYSRTDANISKTDMGCEGAGGDNYIRARLSGNINWRVNSGATSTQAIADSLGMYIASRPDSANQNLYKNKTEYTAAVAAGSLVSEDFFIGAQNASGSPSLLSTRQISMAFVGAALTQSDVNILTDAFEVYMDSNNKGVIT